MNVHAPARSDGSFATRHATAIDTLAIAAIAAAVYGLHGFQGGLSRDLGIFVYGGEQVARGTAPYVANFNTVGPLADAVPGAATALGHLVGIGPVLAPRLLDWLVATGCVALIATLARDVLDSRASAYVAAALFLPFGTFLRLATDGPREKTVMVLFLVGGLVLLCRRRYATAGVLAGLATLTWQPALVPLLAAAGAAAVLAPRRLRSILLFLTGGALTAAAAVIAYGAVGALGRALDAFLVANALWVHQPSAFSRPDGTWQALWQGYGPWLALALLGPVVLVAAAIRSRTVPLLLTAAGGVAAVGWTAADINGAPDLFVVLPFGALGGAVLVHAVVRAVGARSHRLALGLAAVVCAVAVVAATTTAIVTRHDTLSLQVRDVRAVLRSAPAGSTMIGIDAPQPLALTDRINPSPFLVLDTGEIGYLDHRVRGGLAGYLASLLHRGTPLLAIRKGYDHALVVRLARQDYHRAGRAPGWHWWVARDLGRRVDRRVERAAKRAMTS